MNEKINSYVKNLFTPYEKHKSVAELKHDLLIDLNEKFNDLIINGEDERVAYTKTINSIGDIEEMLKEMICIEEGNVGTHQQILVDFNAQDLTSSDFAGVKLHGGKFGASAIVNADFSNADLTGSSFKSSDIKSANFNGANLTDCVFFTSDLSGANFNGTIFIRTIFDKSGIDNVKFTNCEFTDIKFLMADMRKVEFEGSSISGGEFKFCDLTGRNFDGMYISNALFGNSALKNTSFKNATLKNVSFSPPFALSKKYYNAIKTIDFTGASIDKLTYNALKGLGANLNGVTIY